MNRRRKTDLIEANEYAQANPMPEINRAHRDCERECIELRNKLSRCAGVMIVMNTLCEESGFRFDEADELITEIDAILPATEEKYIPQTKLSQEYE